MRLCSWHNLRFLVRLGERMRESIVEGSFPQFGARFLADYSVAAGAK